MPDDDYPTCARTYATLRIYPGEIDPTEVTGRLGIEPSSWQRRGEVVVRADRPSNVASINGWFLTSQGRVDSRDSRRHIDWILDQIAPAADGLQSLKMQGCRMDISCYWVSRSGHGGPTIPPPQMRKLADLDMELWFDFYGPYEDDDD